jgi:hypothetical protein
LAEGFAGFFDQGIRPSQLVVVPNYLNVIGGSNHIFGLFPYFGRYRLQRTAYYL